MRVIDLINELLKMPMEADVYLKSWDRIQSEVVSVTHKEPGSDGGTGYVRLSVVGLGPDAPTPEEAS